MSISHNCHCSCGQTAFGVSGEAITRVFCHCTICQKFNGAPFADVTIFHLKDALLPPNYAVEYKRHRFFPSVQRGKCRYCNQPAVERFHIPFVGKIVIVPTANIRDAWLIPKSDMHIFYEYCVDPVEDALPKYKGYWRSQIALLSTLI